MLIFAFGSNLSREQMRRRCPGCTLVGPAMLDGYRLAFGSYSAGWDGGVATVVRAKGHKVRGVLYHMEEPEVLRLDRFEGCPAQYQRVSGRVRWGRKHVTASWYVLNAKPFTAPSARYLAAIATGYREFRFSKKALRASLVYTRDRMLEQAAKERKRRRAGAGRPAYSWTPQPRQSRTCPPPASRQIEMWQKRHGTGEWWKAG